MPATTGEAMAGTRTLPTTPSGLSPLPTQFTPPQPRPAIVAPISPPNRACEELEGRPSSQVSRFHTIAPVSPASTMISSAVPPPDTRSSRGVPSGFWTAYAAVLFVAPTLWMLPPLAGIVVLLVPLRRHPRQLAAPLVLDRRDVASDLVRGLLLGAVLWADKFVFLLVAGRDFAVDVVFLALLPAILAYNAYFVLFAPRFDRE